MAISRQAVLEQLTDFLKEQISAAEIHGWILREATTTEGYQEILKSDLLVARTLEALINLENQDPKRIAPRKLLVYYQKCLTGEIEYKPIESPKELEALDIDEGLSSQAVPAASQPDTPEKLEVKAGAPAQAQKPFSPADKLDEALIVIRIYVIIFGACSLVVHLYAVINPLFLSFGLDVPTRFEALREAAPDIIYAYFLLLPQTLTAKRAYFYVTFPVLIFGMLYYWYITTVIVAKLTIHPMFILAIAPFTAVPATLAFVLLILRREEYRQVPLSRH